LHSQLLLDKAASEGKVISTARDMGWKFGKLSSLAKPLVSVALKWPASRYTASWSESEKRWLLDYDGSPDMDSDGKQLGASTLVIQKVTITPSEYHDKVAGAICVTERRASDKNHPRISYLIAPCGISASFCEIAAKVAPEEMPTNKPSSRALRLPNSRATSAST
jgi:hypothetical protein